MKISYSNLPNALIIGAQKAGTTWLAARLSQHPDIYIPRGEIHYFDNDRNFARGESWYSSFFSDSSGQKIICEKTPDYLWTTCQNVPLEPKDKSSRIKNLLPNAKLLVLLRNPVNRAISAWNHNIASGAIDPSLDINNLFTSEYSEIVSRHGILSRGLYSQQLSDYLEHFDKKQILILFFETDILRYPRQTMNKALTFLEINTQFSFNKLSEPENKPTRTKLGVSLTHKSVGLIRKVVHKLDETVASRTSLPKWKPPMPNADILCRLYNYYLEEQLELESMIGPLPKSWSSKS